MLAALCAQKTAASLQWIAKAEGRMKNVETAASAAILHSAFIVLPSEWRYLEWQFSVSDVG